MQGAAEIPPGVHLGQDVSGDNLESERPSGNERSATRSTRISPSPQQQERWRERAEAQAEAEAEA